MYERQESQERILPLHGVLDTVCGVKTVVIIQARMRSTRLPGKVLMDIAGRTMLSWVVRRAQKAKKIDGVLVATTLSAADQAVEKECQRLSVPVVRGSELDVLDRYQRAAAFAGAEAIVRITADCPFIDPAVVDDVVTVLQKTGADYASNILRRTFPRGLDCEIMTADALERAWREACLPHEREHVTPYLYEHPELFHLENIEHATDLSQFRLTVDTEEDLRLARAIYERLGKREDLPWQDITALLESDPALAQINRSIQQKSLHGTV